MNSPDKYEFSVEVDGKKYQCQRSVSGSRELNQTIYVQELGKSKIDSASYGPNGHPYASMESVARIIALEIIREN